jgi:hypothetical protein
LGPTIIIQSWALVFNQKFVPNPHDFPTFSPVFPTLAQRLALRLLGTLRLEKLIGSDGSKGENEMKKIIYFFVLAVSFLGFFVYFTWRPVQAVVVKSEAELTNSPEKIPAAANAATGSLFPDTIEDPDLLKALETLSQHQEAIQLWDGKTVTGQELADFVKKNNIPVVWGSQEICGGASCSLLYFNGSAYMYEDDEPGVDPIYINPSAKDQTVGRATRLLRELSHEIFHRMRPFGLVNVTQYEEYWAYAVETQLSHAAWPVFEGYDPQDPTSLQEWFTHHSLGGYLALEAFPNG